MTAALFMAALALLGTTAHVAGQTAESATRTMSLRERAEMSRAKGDADAPVLVYEIADFQCPYCARFARDVFPTIDAEFIETGRVRWVFVNLPLPMHPFGWAAAEAALCAGAVGQGFWAMHDQLYGRQAEWSAADEPTPHFIAYAREADVPTEPFLQCMQTDAVARLILEDVISAAASQVTGTPTFVIDNEQLVVGLKSVEEWREMLEEALEGKN